MKRWICAVALFLLMSSLRAAEIAMVRGDDAGTSSYLTGTNFSDHLAPVAGNTYKTANYGMRSPNDVVLSTNYVFAGDKLTISSGGSMLWKTGGFLTVDDLVLGGGTITHGFDNMVARLAGNITVSNASSFSANEPNARDFIIYSTVKGTADLTVNVVATNSSKQFSLMADNSGFTGKLLMRGAGKLSISREENLGGAPAAFVANQLDLAGTTLLATNSFKLDDPTRGILLNRLASPVNATGGVFEVNNSATVTVACVVSGVGGLTKRGNGTLSLETNGTYTGVTTVESGTLRLKAGSLPATAAVTAVGTTAIVAGEGTLATVSLKTGGQLRAENGGWAVGELSVSNGFLGVDLSSTDPDVTAIRVSGAISKPAFSAFVFTVDTKGASEIPYKLLSAPNLSDFSGVDFCVSPPWIGELSLADDGGGKVLLFTPTPPEKILFKTANDAFGDTAFTNANWTGAQTPVGGNTYVSRSYEMRTPPSGNNTFVGKHLVFDNAQNISAKGTGTATIPDLTLMNNASFGMTEPTASRIGGHINLYPLLDAGRSYACNINGWSNLRSFYLYASLSGYGDLNLSTTGDPQYGVALDVLSGQNTNFYGRLKVTGNTNFWLRVAGEENLGGVPPAFRADQLIFNGAGLSVTNDVTLDDANRGITLLADGGTGSTSTDSGSYTNNTPAADRRFEGGVVLRPESNSVTLMVNCPITGPGRLVKDGSGTLVLGGYNTYTGQTVVAAGALVPAVTNAFGSGPLVVRAGGTLQIPYPAAALPNGVELGSAATFESGSAVAIAFDPGYTVTGNFTVPLFLLPPGGSIDPASVPLVSAVENYTATVTTSTVGEGASARTLVSATFRFGGTLLLLQ